MDTGNRQIRVGGIRKKEKKHLRTNQKQYLFIRSRSMNHKFKIRDGTLSIIIEHCGHERIHNCTNYHESTAR